MKVLLDMNLSPRWADYLGQNSVSAAHWSTIGQPDATDFAIMDYARKGGWIVMTYDIDFTAILAATNESGPSVIQVRSGDASPESIGTLVIRALRRLEADLVAGAIVTITRKGERLRVLPLRR